MPLTLVLRSARSAGTRTAGTALVCAGLFLLGCKDKSGSAEEAAVPVASSPAANAKSEPDDPERKAVRKTIEELKSPGATPPADAKQGPMGVHYRGVRSGNGVGPKPHDQVNAEVTVWTPDGTLAFSSYQQHGHVTFTMSTLPPLLQDLVGTLGPNSITQFWLPVAALEGWKPKQWPDGTDLILQLEVLSVAPAPPQKVLTLNRDGTPVEHPFPIPDAAGPPQEARRLTEGVAVKQLRKGAGRSPGASDRTTLSITAWTVEGVMVQQVLTSYPTTTRPERLPPVVADVLKKMTLGEIQRIWLPSQLADSVVPGSAGREVVADVELKSIE